MSYASVSCSKALTLCCGATILIGEGPSFKVCRLPLSSLKLSQIQRTLAFLRVFPHVPFSLTRDLAIFIILSARYVLT